MVSAFDDSDLGLKLRGYTIIPNDLLETKIAIYTPEIAESILMDHPEVVDKWLNVLHAEYISKKKQCDFDSDPVACFTLSAYEIFDKSFKSWEEGGLIAISLPQGRVIRVSKKPLITIASGAGNFVCSICTARFSDSSEFENHRKQEAEIKLPARKQAASSFDYSGPKQVGWLSQ